MTQINPYIYQCLAISKGLEFYAKTGMRINRAYTPKNMMAMAERLTSRSFKARDYAGAAQALKERADEIKIELLRQELGTQTFRL